MTTEAGSTADTRAREARRRRDLDVRVIASAADPGAADHDARPALSVVVPTHDVGPWVREMLESLVAQTFDDLEIIVVEDHSTDETDEIVSEIAATDSRIRIVRPEGRGGAHARNVGVALARGRYLAFCDGDDIVPEGAYAALMARTVDTSPDLVVGDFLKFRPSRTWRPAQRAGTFAAPLTGTTVVDLPQLVRHRACWNKVYRRDFWADLDLVFPEVPRSNDVVPVLGAYLAARSIDVVTDVTYVYRDRPGASSMSAKVGSATSLASYLQQEIDCAAMVDAFGSPEVTAEHSWMLLNADTWVQLSEHLEQLDGSPADPAIADLAATLLSRVAPSSWTPDVVPQLRRRWAMSAAADGRLDDAAEVLRLTSKDRVEPDPVHELTAWADALAALPATPDGRSPSRQEVADRWLPRRIRAALASDDRAACAEALHRLLTTVAATPSQLPGGLADLDTSTGGLLGAIIDRGPSAVVDRPAGPAAQASVLPRLVRRLRGRR